MDLWNCKNVKQKARELIENRGFKVSEVYSLTTGLWVAVKLMDGSIINVMEGELIK